MGYDSPDVYYQPEAFGLVTVGSLDDPDACYSFNYLAVWHHPETDTLYWGTDSGCSCPSPFEDFTSLDKLVAVHRDDSDALAVLGKAIHEHCNYALPDEEWRGKATDEIAADRAHLRDKIRALGFEVPTCA